jgi:hypothetical protein
MMACCDGGNHRVNLAANLTLSRHATLEEFWFVVKRAREALDMRLKVSIH